MVNSDLAVRSMSEVGGGVILSFLVVGVRGRVRCRHVEELSRMYFFVYFSLSQCVAIVVDVE